VLEQTIPQQTETPFWENTMNKPDDASNGLISGSEELAIVEEVSSEVIQYCDASDTSGSDEGQKQVIVYGPVPEELYSDADYRCIEDVGKCTIINQARRGIFDGALDEIQKKMKRLESDAH
jgi:hypothetical protein